MEYVDWVSFVLSFLLVIALLGATLWGLKRFGRMQLQNQSGQASIKLIDSFTELNRGKGEIDEIFAHTNLAANFDYIVS